MAIEIKHVCEVEGCNGYDVAKGYCEAHPKATVLSLAQGDLRLARDTAAVCVHGTTGQDLDEGTLEVGTLVRNVEESTDEDGDTVTYYQASTNGGVTWFDQRTHAKLVTKYA